MRCLNVWLALGNLLDQIFVDLAQRAVQHLASFKHVENAIGEDRLTMTDSIYVKQVLIACDGSVDFEAQGLDVKGQSESVLLELLLELKICNC